MNHIAPKTKIEFSNKESTRYLYIKGVGTLFGSGLTNLTLLMDLSQSLDKTTIKVDSGATVKTTIKKSRIYRCWLFRRWICNYIER
ncbi:hypothetical protein NWE60_02160 [Mycoplasmopsis felis]|nr:hypothetical protein [Mycoplasmopsis felis]WAM01415.1 hypothetical protein NWE60_02160 [Mycoplasmopsis felis]